MRQLKVVQPGGGNGTGERTGTEDGEGSAGPNRRARMAHGAGQKAA